MNNGKEHYGVAALAIFESLIISLKERELISDKEADNVLADAVAALELERAMDGASATYGLAIDVINRIKHGTNGVRTGEPGS